METGPQTKRALIFGGGGFIGSHLAKRLSAKGYWLRCVDLQRPRHSASVADEFMLGDLRDPKTATLALEGKFDEIYQLAGEVGQTDVEIARNSTLINLNVLGACRNVGRILYASGGSFDWENHFNEQLYLAHGQSYGIPTRIVRLENIFGPESRWDSGRTALPVELCRKIAEAETGGEIELWSDGPLSILPIDECVMGIETLMHSDCAEPTSLPCYSLTIHQLARMIMEIAKKTLSVRNIACQVDGKARASASAKLGLGPVKESLVSTYWWLKAQVEKAGPSTVLRSPTGKRTSGRIMDHCLLERVRDAIRNRDLIDWPKTEYRSLLERCDAIHLEGDNKSLSRMKDGAVYEADLGDMIRQHKKRRTSHVLMSCLDENWGAFSKHVPDRTWADERVIAEGCTPEEVQEYLNDPAVKAVVTTQHTAFWHPKIMSIPIGVHYTEPLLDHLRRATGEKTEELLINNSGWAFRVWINDKVIENFGGTLRNTYDRSNLTDFYGSILRSKFVLCPSAWGWDSHRHWETLLLGSIPVVEYSEGWHTVLDDLPCLWVKNFDEVTPELLAKAYPEIHAKCDRYDFGKLTSQWWTSRINGLVGA